MRESGTFAPRALPRFLATMSPSDSRPGRARGYGFPPAVAHRAHPPGLPGSSIDLSSPAVPNHPGEPDRCLCSLLGGRCQASTLWEDGHSPLCIEAESGSRAARTSLIATVPRRAPGSRRRDRPFRAAVTLAAGSGFMVNEQFPWLTPRSQLDNQG